MHGSLRVESHVVKKAFGTLAFIIQNIEYRSWEVMFQLYKDVGKTAFRILCSVLGTLLQENIVKLETVQKRFTRMLPGLEGVG